MPALLVLAFLVVPILEIYLIIQVGQAIGGWQTLALLIVESMIGAWLVKREGRRSWRALQQSLSAGRMPDRELLDGALVLVGATLLLTPGFATDVAGFALVLPFTRPVIRRTLTRILTRRLRRRVVAMTNGPGRPPGRAWEEPGGAGEKVIRGEVIVPDSVDQDDIGREDGERDVRKP